ncbi:RTA1 like protein-domain-containing protein [Lasiosphaeris hirsuta]|uniref:RTA1 like protein-domain-containing protein n=1 Tax=Lasiosphaeris hirsuta TaxID=260670 RepID=A0AA40A1G4_9PEZI|nr:RTA1 like protein-domain-containing protein [Lasiosphaeris hirsuta]
MLTSRDCHGDTCFLPYQLTSVGSAFMLAAFTALIPINLYTGIRYNTPFYSSLVVAGLLVEVAGHVGNILLRVDPGSQAYFSLYMIGTLWGSTLVGAAIYLVLPRVMVIYGQEFRLVSRPIYCSILFLVFDIFTLAFQSVGVAFTANGSTPDEVTQGMGILLAGLVMQAASLIAFLAVFWYFKLKLARRHYVLDLKFSSVFLSSRKRLLMQQTGIQVATGLLLLRAIIRVASFSDSLGKRITGSQAVILSLDDTFVLLAFIILSVVPAGRAFGYSWQETSPFSNVSEISGLPFRRRAPAQSQKHLKGSIGHPRPITSVFVPLPQHPASQRRAGLPVVPPLKSPPYNKPSFPRAAYEASPASSVPYSATDSSPASSLASPGDRRKRQWQMTSPNASHLVKADSLWG